MACSDNDLSSDYPGQAFGHYDNIRYIKVDNYDPEAPEPDLSKKKGKKGKYLKDWE